MNGEESGYEYYSTDEDEAKTKKENKNQFEKKIEDEKGLGISPRRRSKIGRRLGISLRRRSKIGRRLGISPRR